MTTKRARKNKPKTRKITLEVPADFDLTPYTLGNGRKILTFSAVKREGKPAKNCCVYCERGFHQPQRAPLDARKLEKLDDRKKKKIEATSNTIHEAIRLLRRNDLQAERTVKTDAEYLKTILENAQIEADEALDQAG